MGHIAKMSDIKKAHWWCLPPQTISFDTKINILNVCICLYLLLFVSLSLDSGCKSGSISIYEQTSAQQLRSFCCFGVKEKSCLDCNLNDVLL